MNDQLKRMEKGKITDADCYIKSTLKKKAPLNNMSFQIRVQNMIKQIRVDQFERSRCLSEYENRFPYIQRLNPITRPQNIEPLNLKLSTIRTTSRQSNLIIDGTIKKEQQKQFSSKFRFKSQTYLKSLKILQQEQNLNIGINVERYNYFKRIENKNRLANISRIKFFQNISSWSRKSSDSII